MGKTTDETNIESDKQNNSSESIDCYLCQQEPDYPIVCHECSKVYCKEHANKNNHKCGKNVFSITLMNDSEYIFPLSETRKRLVKFFVKGGGRPSFLRRILIPLIATPVTFSLFILMWVWHPIQFGTIFLGGIENIEQNMQWFVLDSDNPWRFYTWFTSIISHGSFFHLLINSFVLAMFGPFVERSIGSKKYLIFFILAGLISGLSETGVAVFMGESIRLLGASGAISALLGYYAIREPDVRVYLLFIIPMPMIFAGVMIVGVSYIITILFGVGAFNLAHIAHGSGALFGMIYALLMKYSESTSQTNLSEKYEIVEEH